MCDFLHMIGYLPLDKLSTTKVIRSLACTHFEQYVTFLLLLFFSLKSIIFRWASCCSTGKYKPYFDFGFLKIDEFGIEKHKLGIREDDTLGIKW